MKLWMKGALAGLAVLVAGGGVAVVWGRKAEADFQTAADAKRVNDVHKIAEMLEEHRGRTGGLPFEQDMPPQSVLTVLIAAPESERELAGRGNPLGPEPPSAFAGDLLGAMWFASGTSLRLPVDPQRGATGAPNGYYVRFKPGGQYLVAAFLRRPRENTTTVAPGVYAYALRSQTGAWGGDIWAGARKLADVSTDERALIRASGERADSEFGAYMSTSTRGSRTPAP